MNDRIENVANLGSPATPVQHSSRQTFRICAIQFTVCIAVALLSGAVHAQNTIDPSSDGSTDVIQDPSGAQILLTNPLPSPFITTDGVAIGNTLTGELLIEMGADFSNAFGYIGNQAGSTGTVTVRDINSIWTNSSDLRIGRFGTGTLNIENGAQVFNTFGTIADNPGSIGGVTVTGTDAVWNNSSFLLIGNQATGSLDITNGGHVLSNTGTIGNVVGSMGSVNVSDAGSIWDNTGSLFIGDEGNGTLSIAGGAQVNNLAGRIGVTNSGVGSATVTDGDSTWDNADVLIIGQDGSGTLDILNGGVVQSVGGIISSWTGTSEDNEVTVSGVGSRWENSGDLDVGRRRKGTLTLQDNAVVECINAMLGSGDSGNGVVQLTTSSDWFVDGNLYVGGNSTESVGTGTIDINSNSWLDVVGETRVWSDGIVNVDTAFMIVDEDTFNSNGFTTQSLAIEGGIVNCLNNCAVGKFNNGSLTMSSNGLLDIGNSALNVGEGTGGHGSISIADGSVVANGNSLIKRGIASVDGLGSRWDCSSLSLGGFEVAAELSVTNDALFKTNDANVLINGELTLTTGVLEVSSSPTATVGFSATGLGIDGGSVSVDTTTEIGVGDFVTLQNGGSFDFGNIFLEDYSRIDAIDGSLAGNVQFDGFNDLNDLDFVQSSASVDRSGVNAVNSGIIYGSAVLDGSLANQATGELRTFVNDWVRFEGNSNTNAGEINNLGGIVDFPGGLTNEATGIIEGYGNFFFDGGLNNEGVIALPGGFTNIFGDVDNVQGLMPELDGLIVTSGGGTTTFYDDVVNNGEIRTSAGGNTVMFGAATGAGTYTGTGNCFMEGDLRPGNSPAMVTFEGNLVLGTGASTEIEIGGLVIGDRYDQLNVMGDLSLSGQLNVSFIDGFEVGSGQQFTIASVGGNLAGTFNGLPEGSAVPGTDLMISYTGGDGNDVVLYSANAVILGDVNQDGSVNLLDVDPFISVVGSGQYQAEADVDQNGVVNLLDIEPFIAILGN